DVPTYRRVRYDEIYPGIILSYYGTQQQLEYDFEVAPGADPDLIRLAYDGANAVIDAQGDLVLKLKGGELREHKPVVYQDLNGQRVAVDGRFVIRRGREIGFEIGAYDEGRTLVIDPTLVYSTYLGGTGNDSGSSIDIDASGDIYITGTSGSTTFPTQNPFQPSNAGLEDVFITKLDPMGSSILYSTYVGGAGNDHGDGIFVDRTNGAAYVVGRVDALSINFPTTPGAFATTYRGGDFDAFVLKLNPQGNGLAYSTFLGGEQNDSAIGVVADSSGNAYVTGGTRSTGFPATPNAYQSFVAGDTDAYLVKVNPAGSTLLYATLLGGGATDRGSSVRVDSSGNAYLVGFTSSLDFPTQNAFQNSLGGSFDAFVAKIDTNASGAASLVFCSYLGGSSDDKGYGLALDSSNNIYVAGQTSSNDFPVLNPAQAAKGGNFDAFIAKISFAGVKTYATYLGGSGDDRATGIAVNSAENAFVTGYTASTNFPTATPLQSSNGGGTDAFVTKLNSSGNGFLYSTYLGGSANENFTSTTTFTGNIAIDSAGNAYITGYTASNNFPTAAPFQAANAGGASDTFVAGISDTTPAADFTVSALPASQTVNPGNATTYTVTVTPAAGFTGNVSLSVTGLSADAGNSFNPASLNITDSNARSSVLSITTTSSTPPGTYTLSINATSGNIQHSTSVFLVVSGPANANLVVTKTASPNPAIVSGNLTYRIVVTNKGPSPATGAMLSDVLPAGVAFVSTSATQGTCSGASTVTCNFGNLAVGSSAIASILVVPQATGQLSNTASVSATESDPDMSDNSATAITQVTTQSSGPAMLDPNLSVRTVVSGLSQPTSMAFIGLNDFLVLEKDTGRVKRIVNGALQSTVLDLAINSASERGLLGIALHPNFALNGFVYLYWTESSTGADSTNLADVALLGNRVDRYIWNGTVLTLDRNLIRLRAYQADANQPLRGNHDGGVLRFGPDGKLYILMGDNGRRGFLQNNSLGPVPDDQYGGPEPDDSHLTGFVLRLNDDGSTPTDNPFYSDSTNLTGQAAANIKKLYSYGVRNGFGMAFDPLSGNLWDEENGDDAFDEINRITAGANNGWVEIMGPVSRIAEYKSIESTYGAGNLQQLRWPPSLIADTPADAMARLYMLPGAHYNDPEFSWKYALAPSPLGFIQGRGLGPQFEGDMLVGAGRTFLDGGYLFRFKLTPDRLHFSFSDSRLADLVADNADKFDIIESETLLIGKDFGITTDIETGPNGNLFIVSNTNAAVYEISGKQPTLFVANLSGTQEVPPNNSAATGSATLLLSPDESTARVSLTYSGLSSPETVAHIHGPGAPGVTAPVLFPVPQSDFSDFSIPLNATDVQNLKNGLLYFNVHSNMFVSGEIRGQFQTSPAASSLQINAASLLATEGVGHAVVVVTRLGNTSAAATVNYTTSDTAGLNNCNITNGAASSRCDYETTVGTLNFAVGETSKAISIPIVDDSYAEGSETFAITLSNAAGASLGSPRTATVTITDNETVNGANPIFITPFFVRQHYLDFLSREPEAGEPFTAILNACPNINNVDPNDPSAGCDRVNVSGQFFGSPEFRLKGVYTIIFYRLAFNRLPEYAEFAQDLASVTGATPAETFAKRVGFADAFVQRPEFINLYPTGMSNSAYVNALMGRYSLASITTPDPANPDGTTKMVLTTSDLINRLNAATLTRAQVLRAIVQSDEVSL
ncbi:MAG: PQQ-dependent sugar dehydrogenase, partial [Acidobacteriota bacterium]|nr:PQQ-dependent sugar dehydrogenase [Acidobacteriota bacterium]